MNSIKFGYTLTKRWRFNVRLHWGEDGQTSISFDVMEHHDYREGGEK